MRVVRYDIVGGLGLRLLARPTNTAVGVDNFHILANGIAQALPAPVVRFLGTNPAAAQLRYFAAVQAAQDVYRAHPP